MSTFSIGTWNALLNKGLSALILSVAFFAFLFITFPSVKALGSW